MRKLICSLISLIMLLGISLPVFASNSVEVIIPITTNENMNVEISSSTGDKLPINTLINTGECSHFSIIYTEPGDYKYQIKAIPGEDSNKIYDTNVYNVFISVLYNDQNELYYVISAGINDELDKPAQISFENKDKEKPKIDDPVITKNIKDGNSWVNSKIAKDGEVLEFKLAGTISSNYDEFEQYTYSFIDDFPKEESYIENSVNVIAKTGDSEENITYAANISYKNNCLTVYYENLKELEFITKDSIIEVTYNAKLNTKKSGTFINYARLKYENGETDKVLAKVKTKIEKTPSDKDTTTHTNNTPSSNSKYTTATKTGDTIMLIVFISIAIILSIYIGVIFKNRKKNSK